MAEKRGVGGRKTHTAVSVALSCPVIIFFMYNLNQSFIPLYPLYPLYFNLCYEQADTSDGLQSSSVLVDEGKKLWASQQEVTFPSVSPLKHAARILVTKLQNFCWGKETGVNTSIIHTLMCFWKPTNVFDKSPTRVGAIEDSFCATIKLIPQDGAVIHVACVD